MIDLKKMKKRNGWTGSEGLWNDDFNQRLGWLFQSGYMVDSPTGDDHKFLNYYSRILDIGTDYVCNDFPTMEEPCDYHTFDILIKGVRREVLKKIYFHPKWKSHFKKFFTPQDEMVFFNYVYDMGGK